ncbi:hypothetical protein ACH5RR_021993 [Cinchona calisaya]|uniref:Arginine decarboxylase n=1 Tax=Cinchona calisaya TaxID=153742 RepID=A0ABD2Z6J2_9GENT
MPAPACSVEAAISPSPGGSFVSDSYFPALEADSLFLSSATNASSAAAAAVSHWSPALSAALYKIDGWGAPYFTVNSSGSISVRPYGADTLSHQEIDLVKVVKKASDPKSTGGLGLQLPLIVRFPDVLKNRLESLQSAFEYAVQSHCYEGHYQGVYPVKCNQDRFVVEDIVKFGAPFRFGLETGSKPELLLAMSCLCNGSPDALLVCNGFKDCEYISLALLARKLCLNTVIVLEQEEEVDLVIDISKKMGVRPVIGVRAKLRTKHSGHFGSTSGEKGKFGLTTTQILRVVKKLGVSGMLDCLQLLHFHIGSQIPSTALLADGVGEAAQIYCELVRLGACMKVIDIGGGLGIDYDGSKSANSDVSVGYTLQEYASAVVEAVRFVCTSKGIKHPVLCSESGRAIVSHHSILIFEAVSATSHETTPQVPSPGLQYFVESLTVEGRADYRNLYSAAIRGENETCLLFADKLKQRCVDQFKEGSLGIEQLAAVDGFCEFVSKAIGAYDPVHTYHINLSIFTSIPDFWAIGQLFPIVPIHRLDEKPVVKGILSDLTCDSDGKINKFIGGVSSLLLHQLEGNCGGRGYYLGMFLGGAYEQALGGFHNLFGGPSVVHVLQSDGLHSFAVTRAVPGQSSADVLRVMQHEPELMFETLKHRVEEFLPQDHDNGMTNASLANCLAQYFNNMPYLVATSSCCLTANNGYYYCNDDEPFSAAGEDEQWTTNCVA